jgi:hypothetical protein
VFYTSFISLPVFKFHFSFLSISLLTSLPYFLTALHKFQKMKFYFPSLSLYIFTFNFQINYPFLFISIIILYLFLSNILSRQNKIFKVTCRVFENVLSLYLWVIQIQAQHKFVHIFLFAKLQQFILIIPPFNVLLSVYMGFVYICYFPFSIYLYTCNVNMILLYYSLFIICINLFICIYMNFNLICFFFKVFILF